MAQILTLLISAVQLLTLAQTTPNLPPEFRLKAIEIANYAISEAERAIQNQQTEIATTTPPIVSPSVVQLGNQIVQPVVQMPEVKKEIIVDTDVNVGYVNFYVYYLEDNRAIPNQTVTVIAPSGTFTQLDGNNQIQTGNREVGHRPLLGAYFQYVPSDETGNLTLTIQVGGIEKQVTVFVPRR